MQHFDPSELDINMDMHSDDALGPYLVLKQMFNKKTTKKTPMWFLYMRNNYFPSLQNTKQLNWLLAKIFFDMTKFGSKQNINTADWTPQHLCSTDIFHLILTQAE